MKFSPILISLALVFYLSFSTFGKHYDFSTELISGTEEKNDSTTSSKNYLSLGLNYGNNSTFFGRDGELKIPFSSLDLTYLSGSGFYLSGSFFHMNQTGALVDGFDATAGYLFDITSRIDGSVNYSKFFFNSSTVGTLLQNSTSNLASGHLGLDWGYLYSKVSYMQLFGTSRDFFFILSNSRYFYIDKLFGKNDYISFEPRFSVVGGSRNFILNYLTQEAEFNGTPFPPVFDNGSPTSPSEEAKRFKVVNYELRLPITYTIKKFSIEAAYIFTAPLSLMEGETSKPQSLINISTYFVF
jgi:hypothetical protein